MQVVHLSSKYVITAQDPTILGWTTPSIYANIRDLLNKRGSIGGYAIDQPDADDAICFHFESPFWVVYFSERGKRMDPCLFRNWMDAAECFVRKVLGERQSSSLLNWKQ